MLTHTRPVWACCPRQCCCCCCGTHQACLQPLPLHASSSTLLRLHSYFPDASSLRPWLVLICWLVVGLTLSFVGHFRNDEVVHVEGATEAA